MAHQVVGLDIGTYSIKAAVFNTTFRSMSLSNLIESSPLRLDQYEPEQHAEILSKAIAQFIAHYKLESATFCSTLSGKDIILRIKQYPFGPKQALQVLPNDIADDIPIPLEDLMIEHHHFIADKTQTITHAVCAQNQIIQDHLHIVQNAGVEPSMISVDSMALFNTQQFLQHHDFSTYAIVDIGHSKTSICIIAEQQLAFVRTLYSAGFEINQAIHSQLDLTTEQSIEVKEKHGIVETDFKPLQSQDLKKLSISIQTVINPLFREILQSFHMYRSQNYLSLKQKNIEHVFFCGGTANIRNLSHYFTSLVNTPSSIIDFTDTGVDLDDASCTKFSTAMGAALKFASRSKQQLPKDMINYRKGPYSLVQDYGQYKDKGMYYGKWFATFFVLLLTLFMFQNQSMKQEYKNIEKSAVKLFQQYLPGMKVKSSKTAIKRLKAKVTEIEQKSELLTSGLDQVTALGVLREISIRIPDQVKLDTQEIAIDQNKVTLRGLTNSYASVDQIIGYLEAVPFFERIEKGNMREKEDKQIQFQLAIVIGEADPEQEQTDGDKG